MVLTSFVFIQTVQCSLKFFLKICPSQTDSPKYLLLFFIDKGFYFGAFEVHPSDRSVHV